MSRGKAAEMMLLGLKVWMFLVVDLQHADIPQRFLAFSFKLQVNRVSSTWVIWGDF